jgi:predicted dehydrogenase
MKEITVVVVGAGSRGSTYARFTKDLPQVKIVAVAEPNEESRRRFASEYSLQPENVFKDWQSLAQHGRVADVAIVATQDSMHRDSAVALLDQGYHMLLEKPLAPHLRDCEEIIDAANRNGKIFAVCHVLRYTDYSRKLKEIIDSGEIGEIVSIQHLEPVVWWHQAHSFVRGHWRNEEESSFMLLAKSCHDIDWLLFMLNRRCERVSSFGNLTHFRKECRPEGAAERCLDCSIERSCPYSAKRIYLDDSHNTGWRDWPLTAVTPDVTEAGILTALQEGPYGRCVYSCDNDAVDHQVVNFEFEGGRTASFTMTAFAPAINRCTRFFGTHGYIEGDSNNIRIYDYLTGWKPTIDINQLDGTISGGHGGGDQRMVEAFFRAVAENNQAYILSGASASLESHRVVFSAEQARKEGRVISISQKSVPMGVDSVR